MKVKTSIKAGGIYPCGCNHNRNALRVKSSVRAAGFTTNHSRNAR